MHNIEMYCSLLGRRIVSGKKYNSYPWHTHTHTQQPLKPSTLRFQFVSTEQIDFTFRFFSLVPLSLLFAFHLRMHFSIATQSFQTNRNENTKNHSFWLSLTLLCIRRGIIKCVRCAECMFMY